MINGVVAQGWTGADPYKRLFVNLAKSIPGGGNFYVSRLGCWALFGPYCLENNLDSAHFPDPDVRNNAEWNIRPVTKKVNSGEHRRLQGTAFLGEDHKDSKLTEEEVVYIREVYVPRHPLYGQSALARQFGVNQATIWEILQYKIWTHI
jgi:hypothetical protein